MKEKRYLVPPFLIYVLIGVFVLLIIAPPVLKMAMPKEEEKTPVEEKKIASLSCQRALTNSIYTDERIHIVYEEEQMTKLTYFYAKGTLTVPNDQIAYQVGQLTMIEGAEATEDTEQLKIVFPKEVAISVLTTLSNQTNTTNPPQEASGVPEETPIDLSLEGRQTWFESAGYICQVLTA